MQEAVRRRTCYVEGVIKCYPDETLETIIDRIVKAEVDMFFRRVATFFFFEHQRIRGEHSFLVTFRLIPGPSAGPGGQGGRGEGHHLSV